MTDNTSLEVIDYMPDRGYFYYQGRLMRSRVLGAVLAGGEIAIICGIAIMLLGALVQFKAEQAATAAAIVAAQATPTPVATAIPADTLLSMEETFRGTWTIPGAFLSAMVWVFIVITTLKIVVAFLRHIYE